MHTHFKGGKRKEHGLTSLNVFSFSLQVHLFEKQGPHGGELMWLIILLKNFHLFKITESEKNFKQKLITDSGILNK